MKCWSICKRTISAMLAILLVAACVPETASAAQNPSEVMLGIFWSSEEDMTDTLYVSFDGVNFKSIGTAYKDSAPNDASNSLIPESPSLSPRPDRVGEEGWHVNTLHDPGLIYKNGWFWTMSGFDTVINGENRFVPMLGCSKDLVNWSFPNSGSNTNIAVTELPYGRDGQRNNTDWDAVAPDFMVDDDGTVWIVVSMGYYAQWHGDSSLNDVMSPYLIKATGLMPGSNNPTDRDEKGRQPNVTYSSAVPINLPDKSTDRIDGSLYKENGKYYLSIKENGVTNEIWSIDNLNDCQDSSKWTRVNGNVVTGFEGPCLTKYSGSYWFYTDKLADYPHDAADGTTGIFVTRSTGLTDAWTENQRITTTDKNGNAIANRHGTVLTVTDPSAIAVVMDRYRAAGYTYNPEKDKPSSLADGWRVINGAKYWYENGVRQGTTGRGKEIYDPASDAWYWLDAIDNGKMATGKDVYQESSGGKWVRYDENGGMIKGEDLRYGGWYWFDPITGAMIKGFVNIPEAGNPDGKWVYYDEINGQMHHGESCINGNWYYFDEGTGKMLHGERWTEGDKWYYYDDITGIMQKGSVNRNGNWYYYDEITGIMQTGEVCRDGGDWYYYDQYTGIMQKGEVNRNGNWYYYDVDTGIMRHGWVTLPDGRRMHYNEVTGILDKKE